MSGQLPKGLLRTSAKAPEKGGKAKDWAQSLMSFRRPNMDLLLNSYLGGFKISSNLLYTIGSDFGALEWSLLSHAFRPFIENDVLSPYYVHHPVNAP